MAGALASIGVRGLMESPASNFRKRGRNYKKMMKNPPNRTGWFQRRADLAPMVITERMLLRHGWYRRQLRKQGVPLVKGVLNSVMLR
jgi:hypothetical protein